MPPPQPGCGASRAASVQQSSALARHWHLVPPARWPKACRGGLPTKSHLLREQAPFTAVGAELGGVEPGALQHNRELVGSVPALWSLLGCRLHLSLQPSGLPPFVEGHHVDAQLFLNLGHALPVGWHPPPHISLTASL